MLNSKLISNRIQNWSQTECNDACGLVDILMPWPYNLCLQSLFTAAEVFHVQLFLTAIFLAGLLLDNRMSTQWQLYTSCTCTTIDCLRIKINYASNNKIPNTKIIVTNKTLGYGLHDQNDQQYHFVANNSFSFMHILGSCILWLLTCISHILQISVLSQAP